MIEDETSDELGLVGHLVLHVHELNHVQVNGLAFLGNTVDGVDNNLAKGVCKLGSDLGVQGSASTFDQQVAGNLSVVLEGLEELERLSLSELHTIDEDTGVDTFSKVALSLTHELTNKEDISSGTVSDDIILGGSCTTNHGSSRVLDLHLVKKDSSIFGKLNLTGTANEPKAALN